MFYSRAPTSKSKNDLAITNAGLKPKTQPHTST